MKKFLLTLLFGLIGSTCNAQIYTKIKHFDKFDDALKIENRKTLITKTDSTFIIEEKGKQPVVYYILNELRRQGSKDDVVNLVDNVYGYETTWCVVKYDLLEKYLEAKKNYFIDNSEENFKKCSQFWIFAVHRTVTTQFTRTYEGEYFWLHDELNEGKLGKDVSRIIYLTD
ncbi:MAG: hypothetical protein IKT22_05825 [Prevotella sp.]|nr:hypothetical protein [Prevotella sp.]MBR6494765.1 hypothetical protein [Prevotella sp.]